MKKDDEKKHGWWKWCGCCDSGGGALLWGLIVIAVGGYYLGRDVGWIPRHVELWPVLLITVGAGVLLGNVRRWKRK